jgi:hypothetical protein
VAIIVVVSDLIKNVTLGIESKSVGLTLEAKQVGFIIEQRQIAG